MSAGHDPILAYSPHAGELRELGGTDLPLGIESTSIFHEHLYTLEPDAVLVIGTDGIWETSNVDGEQFGFDWLKQTLRDNADRSAKEIMQAILDAVRAFRRPGPQQDDVTVVVVKLVPIGERQPGRSLAEVDGDQMATARR